jgi:RNA polymerase sigma-70 factor (ECF subfamily)
VLYESYKDKVYSIALYYFHGDAAQAADVTQQVFVKVMTSIGEFRGDAGIGTWLYRLTVNACLDRKRSAAAREIASDPETFARMTAAGSPERDASSAEEADRVRAAVSSLPEKLRLPVLLRYFEDLSYEEMAKALDCSAGTVASRLNRGHQLLREKLAKWGVR